jgi:hypothetical protein
MLKKLIAMAILALSLTGVPSVTAIEIPWPTCLPCDPDPPPNQTGGGN